MSRARAGGSAVALVRGAIAFVLSNVVPVAAYAQQPATAATSLVFDGVTVVDVEQGKLVPDQRVVIIGNRIQTMGEVRAVKTPKGAHVVDARGKYLIPGLWDMHVHTTAERLYLLLLANGVTGIRDAWATVPLDTMILWRREIVAGTRAGPPRQILSGAAIDETRTCNRTSLTGHVCVAFGDSADARELVNSLKAAGADMVKTYALSADMYRVIAAEAGRVGIPFGGHLHGPGVRRTLTPVEASDIGAAIIDHNDLASGGLGGSCLDDEKPRGRRSTVERCQPIVERFQHNNTWSVPTILNSLGPTSKDILSRVKQFVSRFWESDTVLQMSLGPDNKRAPDDSLGSMDVARRLGLPIMAGTDAIIGTPYPTSTGGFSLHTVLAVYVAEGMSPLEALQTATLNPAKFLRATDSLGTVARGKVADLVLLDADPLTDITNTTTIRAVVANGRYFDRAALDSLLVKVKTQERERKQRQREP